MNKGKWYHTALQCLLALAFFLLFVSSSVFLTLACKPLYYLDIELLNIEEHSGFEKEEIKENYNALIDYNLPLSDGELIFPGENMMSETAKIHFEEVKDIFDLFKVVALVMLPLCIAGVYYFYFKKMYNYLLYAGVTTLVLPTVVGGLIALNWEKVFLLFHQIAFDNDYWVFDYYEDQVIRILPSAFFMHCAIMIVALVFIGGGICTFLYFFLRKRERLSLAKKEKVVQGSN
ncbi:MAG: TIGR01906 family membrane protein [Clostridia bacterium]|nr:TIGR01906 family membrane protein [Clostridia bacterium]